MARLTPQFCTSRTLRDYTEQHYMPAARRYLERSLDNGALGVRIVEWQRALAQNWAAVRFGELEAKTDGSQHLFELQVYLHDLDPNAVQIELYADGLDGSGPVRQEMKRVRELEGVPGGFVYATASACHTSGRALYAPNDRSLRGRHCSSARSSMDRLAAMSRAIPRPISATATLSNTLDQLCVNTLRFLSVDAVQKADSGHPGIATRRRSDGLRVVDAISQTQSAPSGLV